MGAQLAPRVVIAPPSCKCRICSFLTRIFIIGSQMARQHKMAKYALLATGRPAFQKHTTHTEGSNSTPHPKHPLFAPVGRCVRSCDRGRVVTPISNVGGDLERFLKGLSLCYVGNPPACFGQIMQLSSDFIYSRIKGWRLNRRSARSLLPAVRAVYEGFHGGRLWRLLRRISKRLAS